MHGPLHHPTDTPRRNGHGWWCLTWRLAAVLALGFTLASPSTVQAKTFHCGAGDVQCLIDAIRDANANGEENTIRLAAGTYTLTDVDNHTDGPNGLPSITSPLTITGAGVDTTIIERQASATPRPPAFRLLYVAATGSLTLNGLTLQGGALGLDVLPDPESGGGILNYGTVALTQCTLAHNTAGRDGGGIANFGTLTLTHSTLVANAGGVFLGNGAGGGIANFGTLTLTHSTLVDNTVFDNSGGGVANSGSMTLTNCTVVDNTSFFGGGGIANGGSMTLTNCTVARNMTVFGFFLGDSGGGIRNSGLLMLTNATLVDNTSFFGGGIAAFGLTTLQNTLLARNTAFNSADVSADCFGVVTSLGSNLIGDASGCTIAPQSGDLIDIGDPGVGDFTDNGPPGTGHVPLLPGSPAIDAGNDAACPRQDQLGQRRVNIPRVGTSRCDIGAIEFPGKDHRSPKENEDHHNKDLAAATRATP